LGGGIDDELAMASRIDPGAGAFAGVDLGVINSFLKSSLVKRCDPGAASDGIFSELFTTGSPQH
jgi:hypothetical protein